MNDAWKDERGRFKPGNKFGHGNLRAGAPTKLVNFRMTADEISDLDSLCELLGVSRSSLMRDVIVWYRKQVYP